MTNDDRLTDALAALAEVHTEEKRASLDTPKAPARARLDHAAKIPGVVVPVAGGLWAGVQFIAGEREKIALREREVVAESRQAVAAFALDLSGPDRREAAAFAVATLGDVAAVPLLVHHLRAARPSDEDAFARALTQSLFALPEGRGAHALADMNRRARISSGPLNAKIVDRWARHREISRVLRAPRMTPSCRWTWNSEVSTHRSAMPAASAWGYAFRPVGLQRRAVRCGSVHRRPAPRLSNSSVAGANLLRARLVSGLSGPATWRPPTSPSRLFRRIPAE